MMAGVGHAPFHKLLTRLYYYIKEPTVFTSQKAVYNAATKIDKSISLSHVKKMVFRATGRLRLETIDSTQTQSLYTGQLRYYYNTLLYYVILL